jgi:hypothetical protein
MYYMCYLDESGVQENTGTSHFVLVGLAILADHWKRYEVQIAQRKRQSGLEDAEIHSAWMARRYIEQEQIPGFAGLPWEERRRLAQIKRDEYLIRLSARGTTKQLKAAKLNHRKTRAYIHLTLAERMQLLCELASIIGNWQDARLFAEVTDKPHLYSIPHQYTPFEFCFTELVQRFEYFLRHRGKAVNANLYGLLIQDNNPTIAHRLTAMMRRFHSQGTRWAQIDHIIETPLFVDSHLTSMVQMADLCGYAIRRFFENNETDLFNRVYSRFDRVNASVVGIRHFTGQGCSCKVCHDHA